MFRIICLILCLFSQQIYAGFNELNKIELETLTFKEIMRTFYVGQLVNGKIQQIDEESQSLNPDLPYDVIERKDIKNSILLKKPKILETVTDNHMYSEQEYYGAYLGDIRTYKNAKNEDRYLVGIVIVGLNEHWEIAYHRPQEAILDLYIFKKVGNTYQLVSRTSENQEPTGNVGEPSGIFWNKIKDGQDYDDKVEKIGNNLVGILVETHVNVGVGAPIDQYWNVIRLNEKDYISRDYLEGGSSDTSQDEDSPTYFNYSASYWIKNDNSENYPIFVRYKGDIPKYDNQGEFLTIKEDDYMVTWTYVPDQGYKKMGTK